MLKKIFNDFSSFYDFVVNIINVPELSPGRRN